jgi:hypothetical protein
LLYNIMPLHKQTDTVFKKRDGGKAVLGAAIAQAFAVLSAAFGAGIKGPCYLSV